MLCPLCQGGGARACPIYAAVAEAVTSSPDLLAFLVELPVDKRQPNLFLAAVRHLDGVPRDGAHLAEIVQSGRERNRLMTGSDIGGPGPSADTSVMAGSGSIYSPTKERRG